MPLRRKIYFIVIVTTYFIAVLFALVATANAQEGTGSPVEHDTFEPGHHHTNLTSVQPWILDGKSWALWHRMFMTM
jgi:hypothetical protein